MNKIHRLIGACLTAALPRLALADAPSNVALGEVEAIVKFCIKTDPRLAEDAEKHWTVLIGTVSAGARSSAEYRQGYDLVSDALAKVDRPTALAACSSLAPPRHADALHDRDRRQYAPEDVARYGTGHARQQT